MIRVINYLLVDFAKRNQQNQQYFMIVIIIFNKTVIPLAPVGYHDYIQLALVAWLCIISYIPHGLVSFVLTGDQI